MEEAVYFVVTVNGDYAMLRPVDAGPDEPPFPVAMALLPFGVDMGMRLLWKDLSYTIL